MTPERAVQWHGIWMNFFLRETSYLAQVMALTNVKICRQCGARHGCLDLPQRLLSVPAADLVRYAKSTAARIRCCVWHCAQAQRRLELLKVLENQRFQPETLN